MKHEQKIIFPCKPGDVVFVGTTDRFMDKVVPGKVESVDCIYARYHDAVVTSFRIYVDHEYIYSEKNSHTPANRYIFWPTEVFSSAETAKKAIETQQQKCADKYVEADMNQCFPYEVSFPCEIGDEVFIGSPENLMRKVVPGVVTKIRYQLYFDQDEETILSSCDITAEHNFIYKDELGKDCRPRVMHTDTFGPDEIFSTTEDAQKAIADYAPKEKLKFWVS